MNQFEKLADLTQEIAILQDRKKNLYEECLAKMQQDKSKTVKSRWATFSIVGRRSISYVPEVEKEILLLKIKIKETETEALKNNKAIIKTEESLRVQLKK